MSRSSRLLLTAVAGAALVPFMLDFARADEPGVRLGATRVGLKDGARLSRRVVPVRSMDRHRRSSAAGGERDWLYDYVARVKDGRLWNEIVGEPLPDAQLKWRQRARRVAAVRARISPKASVARGRDTRSAMALDVPQSLKPTLPVVVSTQPLPSGPLGPMLPGPGSVTTTVVAPPLARDVVPSAPPSREVTTGALQVPGQRALDEDEILELAEKSQTALDLVKLELAGRTYDEQKTAGERIFVERPDWKVLENAHDSMSESERSAAVAAGFIAHTYVNDATKTIVVAVAGSQDLRRDFIAADVWQALMRSEAPQHFYFAKSYMKSVILRYQMQGYVTECVGHSLGGGACAYAAAELGVRAFVVNPISAGTLPSGARSLVTNYIVDGDIASIVYPAFGNEISGEIRRISNGRERVRQALKEKYGVLAGPIMVVRDAASSVTNHKIGRALERIAVHAGVTRPR